ncbi:MAG: phosphoglycerate dehydrogenase [Deltaproteobacteria bacterium]|nr:phosphoglycerate dehydrogenase [Deltaproteobacteria bacterium]
MSVTSFPKTEIKILLLENVHPVATEAFAAEGFQVETVKGALPEAELIAKIADAHVLGIRSKTRVTPAILDGGRRLMSVGAFCIGTNQIATQHANNRGVPVFNAPFSNTRSVAELILAEVVMLSRHLGDRTREVHEGVWKKVAVGSHEVRGKTLGIIGYGHIGSQIGVLAEGFGMRVVFYDILAKLPMGNNRSMSKLEDVLSVSDFVTLHVPETPQTRNMIGPEEIAKMRAGACLLNASRGTVVVIDALADGIRRGHVGGAAVDVYPDEPESNSSGFASPLRGLPNVILTPHIGGSTEEAQEAIGREVSASLIKYINTGATTGAVNFPQIELPLDATAHRILNVHKNVPGVLRDITKIVSDSNANVRAQVLSTDPDIGYLLMDLDQDVSGDVKKAVGALSTSIKTRILF